MGWGQTIFSQNSCFKKPKKSEKQICGLLGRSMFWWCKITRYYECKLHFLYTTSSYYQDAGMLLGSRHPSGTRKINEEKQNALLIFYMKLVPVRGREAERTLRWCKNYKQQNPGHRNDACLLKKLTFSSITCLL